MSSKTLDKKIDDTTDEDIIVRPVNLKRLIIPFSEFGRSEKYIYLGFEKIPFKDRHPIYQMILGNEFAKALKEFQAVIRK